MPVLPVQRAVMLDGALIRESGAESPCRWSSHSDLCRVKRICELEEKKQRFEELFRRQLDETDSEFDTLRLYSQKLQVRAMGLRTKKAA